MSDFFHGCKPIKCPVCGEPMERFDDDGDLVDVDCACLDPIQEGK